MLLDAVSVRVQWCWWTRFVMVRNGGDVRARSSLAPMRAVVMVVVVF